MVQMNTVSIEVTLSWKDYNFSFEVKIAKAPDNDMLEGLQLLLNEEC